MEIKLSVHNFFLLSLGEEWWGGYISLSVDENTNTPKGYDHIASER